MKRNKKYEGQELAGEENKGWGRKRRERRGRLVSQMAGLFVWAARRGEGLFICLRTAVARSLLRAHRYSSRTCTLALFMHICKSQWPQVTVFATFKHLGSQSYACELSLKCAQRLLHPLLLAQNKEI